MTHPNINRRLTVCLRKCKISPKRGVPPRQSKCIAREMTDVGKQCLVIDKRDHIGGNIYTEQIEGINVYKYGANIFHTNNRDVWDYINRFAEFNRYTNSPVAYYKGEIYNLPFNMNVFNKMWGVITPDKAKIKIAKHRNVANISKPEKLE